VPPVPTTPVRINQSGCRYEPHVFGIRVGQSLEIVNSDPVLHNIHALAKAGEPFNAAMPPRPQPWTITRVFTRPEVMVRIRCDVHGWMSAWAAAMPHPWFAVTDANGRFTLPPLPPGRYVLVAWHEACGTLRQSVLITPRAGPMVEFTFHVPDKI
jgi:plastocyanin